CPIGDPASSVMVLPDPDWTRSPGVSRPPATAADAPPVEKAPAALLLLPKMSTAIEFRSPNNDEFDWDTLRMLLLPVISAVRLFSPPLPSWSRETVLASPSR